jgi:hypothetical protein
MTFEPVFRRSLVAVHKQRRSVVVEFRTFREDGTPLGKEEYTFWLRPDRIKPDVPETEEDTLA